jgi:hypothetical protein
MDDCGPMIAVHPTIYQEILIKTTVDTLISTADEQRTAGKISKERYLALAFFLGADQIPYGMMIKEIENEYPRDCNELFKVGSYPLTIANAYKYLKNTRTQRIYNVYWVKLFLGHLGWHSPKQTKGKTVAHQIHPR